jgi:hypothetical protein
MLSIVLCALFIIVIIVPLIGCNSNNTTNKTTEVVEKVDPYTTFKETYTRRANSGVITNKNFTYDEFQYVYSNSGFSITLYDRFYSGKKYCLYKTYLRLTPDYKNGFQISILDEVLDNGYGYSYKIFYCSGTYVGSQRMVMDITNYDYEIYEYGRTEAEISRYASNIIKSFFYEFSYVLLSPINLRLSDFGIYD